MKTFKLNGFEFVKVSSDTHIDMFDAAMYTKYIKFCPKLKLLIVYVPDLYEYPKLKIGYLEYLEFRIEVRKKSMSFRVEEDVAFNISDGLDCCNYFFSSYKDSIKYMATSYSDCKKFLLLI